MQLIDVLYGCYGVAMQLMDVFLWLLVRCYAVDRCFWMVARGLLCS